MHPAPRIAFLCTGKSGLGHLRRLATIAARLVKKAPDCRISLISNAPPEKLSADDMASFCDVVIVERQEMTGHLLRGGPDLAVLDTLKLPGFERYSGRAVLILRETPASVLPGFRRAGGRPWDRVLLPHPAEHWQPRVAPGFAASIEPVGWIRRLAGLRGTCPSAGIVVATGGGGTAETRALLYPMLDALIAETRRRMPRPFCLRQVLGPRTAGEALSQTDEILDAGSALNDVFRRADVVISTAGYNSVLELASTDTPTLLAAIPRGLDDQSARVAKWGPRLGYGLNPERLEEAAAWLAARIETPSRRPPVDLGPDGAARAADCLLELLCPVS